jgi:hypothetical protein
MSVTKLKDVGNWYASYASERKAIPATQRGRVITGLLTRGAVTLSPARAPAGADPAPPIPPCAELRVPARP